ncbi:CNNM domain-containing protein, partial [Rhodococcus sp. CX]|uniref:CNNM domain-containing protein n=1 Tax=Rhodococcus sp. CX TaxID=2789880 RepID=UPI001E28975E
AAGLPDSLLHPLAFTVALALVVILHILLGEMVPKNIAIAGPERTAMLLVPVHLLFMRLAKPLIAFYNLCANLSLRLMRVEPKDELEVTVTAIELSEMIGESRSEGLLDEEEHRRLTQALETSGRTVTEVMIPIDRVRTVPITAGGTTLGVLEQAVIDTGFSRYPTLDPAGKVTGYLHIKDVLDLVRDENAGPDTVIPPAEVRELPRVALTSALDDALALLRRTSSHLGGVVDATGTVVGIVALEDLVEEFVGTVRDATHRIADPAPGNRTP